MDTPTGYVVLQLKPYCGQEDLAKELQVAESKRQLRVITTPIPAAANGLLLMFLRYPFDWAWDVVAVDLSNPAQSLSSRFGSESPVALISHSAPGLRRPHVISAHLDFNIGIS